MQSNILRENARMKYDDQLSLNIQNTPKASLDFGFIDTPWAIIYVSSLDHMDHIRASAGMCFAHYVSVCVCVLQNSEKKNVCHKLFIDRNEANDEHEQMH